MGEKALTGGSLAASMVQVQTLRPEIVVVSGGIFLPEVEYMYVTLHIPIGTEIEIIANTVGCYKLTNKTISSSSVIRRMHFLRGRDDQHYDDFHSKYAKPRSSILARRLSRTCRAGCCTCHELWRAAHYSIKNIPKATLAVESSSSLTLKSGSQIYAGPGQPQRQIYIQL